MPFFAALMEIKEPWPERLMVARWATVIADNGGVVTAGNSVVAAGDDQADVIAFLSSPASYGLPGATLARIETHCSIVFLIADRAYKLKRAIRYASLDYTSRASREAACHAELALNRRTAPDLYLAVRSINRDAGGLLAFDGPGRPIDHVVVMRRFAQSDLFDDMAEKGLLTPYLMRELGEAIAYLHAVAERTPAFGGSDAIGRVIADNDRELALVAAELDGAAVSTLGALTRGELRVTAAVLDRRRAEGKVRRCHGDLRLANICLHNGRPTLFDCIEFSDEVGCIDVLYDLAFLLMDLHLRGRGDLGNAVFNAYLDRLPETDGLRLLPLFLSLRAATRSYALAGRARRVSGAHATAGLLTLARRHVEAGIDFLKPAPPCLVMLGGGTADARAALVARLAGLVPPAPGARIMWPSPRASAIPRQTDPLLRAGCSVVITAEFARAAQRDSAVETATAAGARPLGLWLGAAPHPTLDPRLWHGVSHVDARPETLAWFADLVQAARPGPLAHAPGPA
jgi:aminoglycoside phosphotransferase family enzyme